MEALITFRNVSIFDKEDFGLHRFNLELHKRKRYHIVAEHEDQLKSLLGLLEGRFHPEGGVIDRSKKLFTQSDRLLLGDKVYRQTVSQRLALQRDPFFYFEDRKRSKAAFLDLLKAKHIKNLAIYKLKGKDVWKLALLSLLFQDKGIMLISQFHILSSLPKEIQELFQKIIAKSSCSLCLFSVKETPSSLSSEFLKKNSFQTIEIG